MILLDDLDMNDAVRVVNRQPLNSGVVTPTLSPTSGAAWWPHVAGTGSLAVECPSEIRLPLLQNFTN